ncbi:MAG: AAA family ATPase [Saprospiraceae bacterium]|nr:AAA family ATPase [Saprospiraceae bacterium]MBK7738826.1 AAA family ATPase [Saprospiraceae bacterium]MBK7912602.1 AAA family ATPase [Saprospiraceae bacterium]
MKINKILITNFRLLENVSINIENDITLIVGKNNTGKTSLFEVINMFTSEKNNFSFHDFSQSTYSKFEECYKMYKSIIEEKDERKREEQEINLISSMPCIELTIELEYDKENDSLINISEFISDLEDERHNAIIKLIYKPKESVRLFNLFVQRKEKEDDLIHWLNNNLTHHYEVKCYGGDNLIDDNYKKMLFSIMRFESIQASRKFDDTKSDNNKTLAVGFSDYYRESNKDNNDDVNRLETQLKETAQVLNEKYENILKELLEKLKLFGVEPHITIPEIVLQAEFDPENILRKNIKYFYKQGNITLPENYNGLGYSNLIYLVLKVVSFIDKFQKDNPLSKSETLTILIEEPEAHLHPQMQQVFISQIKKSIIEARNNDNLSVQVIISTHSAHIITEAGIDVDRSFERIRYFSKIYFTEQKRYIIEVKDFNEFKHRENDIATFRFLKQYMSLNRCDIFFADKVILVEGSTERLLLPLMINKVAMSLNNEYISIIEVGGAYTVKFKELIKFIAVKTLVITDIDSVDPDDNRRACPTNKENARSSNSTLINWLPQKTLISELISCPDKAKYDTELIRVAYQIKEVDSEYVARSLEEAIININKDFFNSKYATEEGDFKVKDSFTLFKGKDLSASPYELAPNPGDKTNFTFDLMIFNESENSIQWNVPKYIKEGLEWLASNFIE